jgi:hypothetical protein
MSPPKLRRAAAAAFLTINGYPCSAATLATLVCRRDGGPKFQVFGRLALYDAADLLAWASGRVQHRGGPPVEAPHRREA